tara:strand:- start:330 stop:902 length:573 start_codon:yes stop_codon:yes gene_type:complete
MKILNTILILFISVNSFSGEKLFEKADSLFQLNKTDSAILLYQEIIDNNMESAELYYNIGVCYFQKEKFKKSKFYFQKSLVLNPKAEITKARISQCNLKLGRKSTPKIFYMIWKNKLLSFFSKNVSIIISLTSILSVFILLLVNIFGMRTIQKRYIILLFLISLFFHFIISSKIEKESILLLKDNTESIK